MGDSASENSLNNVSEEVARVLEAAKELQDSASSLIAKASSEEQALRLRVVALDSSIQKLRSSIDSAVKKSTFDRKEAEKLDEELYKAKCILSDGDASSYLPNKYNGSFLKMFLGPINVRANRKDIQLKVKEEYNSYRDRTALLFLLFPSLLLILGSKFWNGCMPALPVQLYQAWLLFLYTSLALRENILRANGSDIRPWWVYHHYCAMLMALISLTWEIKGEPDCANKQKGVKLFLIWAVMQGFAMMLQNRYQRQRLYTRIALGKCIAFCTCAPNNRMQYLALLDFLVQLILLWNGLLTSEIYNPPFYGLCLLARRMDVVWGETAGVEGQLLLLCPLLFILQGFEAYIGVLLLRTVRAGLVSEWQVVVCGILLVVMAVGNFMNTVQTLISKSKVKAKMRRTKSRVELDQAKRS